MRDQGDALKTRGVKVRCPGRIPLQDSRPIKKGQT